MSIRTRIKVCGMKSPDEVQSAIKLGVDAVGIILHANSPRLATVEEAKHIRAVVPAFVTLVGVFVDADESLVSDYYNDIGLDLIQYHGCESPDMIEALNLPFVKAIRAQSRGQVEREAQAYPGAQAILLDPFVSGVHGGTGKVLSADLWPTQSLKQKLVLAGGLSPDNVGNRVGSLKPYAVDVNSGVELSPGRKSMEKLANLVRQVGISDAERNSVLADQQPHV
ncbi:phosphoribosylanthranilate isomerase [Arenicella sp. 4NH20-0111]|uniref:phosphoribosylanthranilate isomerase n=1 Tax=Arenicella sp. 4NH20-0111 TaxID=3127648 RepID=UPI00333FE626